MDLPVGSTTAEELAASVGKNCEQVSPDAKFLMAKMPVAPNLGTVNLAVLTPRDLGFSSFPRTEALLTKEFCLKWSAEHLEGSAIELCEAEDGPRLREQYQDQPNSEVLRIAMERIIDSNGDPVVFVVGRDGGGNRYLGTQHVHCRGEWSLDRRIVFRFRKLPLPLVS